MPLIVIDTLSEDLIQACFGIKFGESLASVIHFVQQMPDSRFTILDTGTSMKQMLVWYSFEFNIFLTFSNSLKHREQTNTE